MNLNCGHLFSRKNHATRWDEGNAFAQTNGENLSHEHDSYPFNKWFQDMFGMDQFDFLHAKWSTTSKFSTIEIREIGDYYKKKYENLLSCDPLGDTLVPPVDDLNSLPEGVW